MPDYRRTGLKISGNRSDGVINPIFTFVVQNVFIIYGVGEGKGTTLSVDSHL